MYWKGFESENGPCKNKLKIAFGKLNYSEAHKYIYKICAVVAMALCRRAGFAHTTQRLD